MKPTLAGAVVVTALLLLRGCVSVPAQWAKALPETLRCGMTVAEVEKVTGKSLRKTNRRWGTHTMGEETERTIAYLTFNDQGLRYIQIFWSEALIGLGVPQRGPQIDLCSG